MLRTRRTGNGRVLFTLSGRIETEDIKQLQELLAVETSGRQLVLDLRDVTLVNEDAVKFLDRCEADLTEHDAYLCGPPPMVDAGIELMARKGVPPERVHYDKFTTTASAEEEEAD